LGKSECAVFSGSAISAPQNTPKVEASFQDELAAYATRWFHRPKKSRLRKEPGFQERKLSLSSDARLVSTLMMLEISNRTAQLGSRFGKEDFRINAGASNRDVSPPHRPQSALDRYYKARRFFKKVGVFQK